MLTKSHLLMAAALVIGTTSAALADEQWRRDPTPDHLFYYGPIAPTAAPKPVVEHRTGHHKLDVPIDRTQDHLYYYGPVEQ